MFIEGTDEEELAQGVGHYTGTGCPGENKQILLSGHRDTVFRQFGELSKLNNRSSVSSWTSFEHMQQSYREL